MLLAKIRSILHPSCQLRRHGRALFLTHRVNLRKLPPYHPIPLHRLCSSRSGQTPDSPWKTLNRVPTPDCLFSDPKPSETSTGGFFAPEIEALYRGNQRFRDIIADTTPNLLKDLAARGQKPPFMLLDCSDSRVGEQVIFSAEPGTLFTTGNIANQFHEHDLSSKSVLSYAVDVLKVKHVIVMGHYGCGGVAAATLPRPAPQMSSTDLIANPVQDWIQPIREIYMASQRPEIVEHRRRKSLQRAEAEVTGGHEGQILKGEANELPHLHDPAFRALVQENVRANVLRIARSFTIMNQYASIAKSPEDAGVFIHGWVYDIETGEVTDLGVSVGPPGVAVPVTPFPVISES